MAVTYRKLWHMLIDRKMKKKELQAAAGLTHYVMLKLSRDEDVTTESYGFIPTRRTTASNISVVPTTRRIPAVLAKPAIMSVRMPFHKW